MNNPEGHPCQICGNPKAMKKYNAYVCYACREFFYRHYPPKYIFACPYNCQISYKKQRQNCTDCRLKKCLDANMRREGGHAVVDHLSLASYHSYAPMKKLMEMYGDIMNNGFKIVGNLKNCKNVTDWVNRMAHFGGQLLSRDGSSSSSVVANTAMSLNDLLMFPGSCIDRSTRVFDVWKWKPTIPYKLKESILRIIVGAIENMALVEEFHLLPVVDKMKLVQQNALMLSVYVLHGIKHTHGRDMTACVKYLDRFKLTSDAAPVWNRLVSSWTSVRSRKLDALWREIQPTDNEMMLVRIRNFFRPCMDQSDDGYPTIIKIRLKLAYRLGEYIREVNPSFSYEQIHKRVCQLLEVEHLMEDIQVEFNSSMTAMTAQDSNGFGAPLLHDIFVRRF